MLERDGYPSGVPCWVDTAQPAPDAAMRFYAGLFGWDFHDRAPPDAPGRYHVARMRGRDVAAVAPAPQGGPTPVWATSICVDSADDAAARVTAAGGTVLTAPFDVRDAGRAATIADPAGARFHVWQPKAHRGAQAVNAPGTWNWSDLNTRDLAGAEAFYGAVFGWQTSRVAPGVDDYRMFRLPGYGEFLERFDPGLRQRLDEGGAPEGFEDAVAWLVLMTSPEFPDDAAPHWAVTFAVDDTDAAVGRVVELGGRVVTPPFDAPPVRVAVVADPQGAVFSVSRYDPNA